MRPSPEYCLKLGLTIILTFIAIYAFTYTYVPTYVVKPGHSLEQVRLDSMVCGFLCLFCMTLFPKEETGE